MEPQASRDTALQFSAPESSLGDLEADVAARLIATAADVALIVDPDGTIHDIALGSEGSDIEGARSWVGQPWTETVTAESRAKVQHLLNEAKQAAPPRWREINHSAAGEGSIPIRYAAMQAGRNGRIIAIGRDLRAIAAAQQRLVGYQQSMEREYARLRHAETRYRLLFQISAEAVLIVDAGTAHVVDANPAAGELLGETEKRIVGRTFLDLFTADTRQTVEGVLATARAVGRGEAVEAVLTWTGQPISVAATLFRQEKTVHFLVRLHPVPAARNDLHLQASESRVLRVMENLPDGFVVTDPERRILTVNASFLEMTQLASEDQAHGQSLDRWLGRPGVDTQILAKTLKDQGSVNNYATVLHTELGTTEEVEISAVSVEQAEEPCLGFVVRAIGRRVATDFRARQELPQSVEQLTELVGRVPLKDLVRDTTDIIERMCVEAALELTGDNRASAAQMLGLSRQSLYAKLRRYGIGGDEDDS
jgi:transcriptional regulator PpsR